MNVTLFLNHKCNMRCSYCYNGRKFDKAMPVDIMKQGIEMAMTGRDARISFFGGEPLMAFDEIQWAVEHARKREAEIKDIPVRFSLTVNGTLLDARKLAFLKKERFHLVVSIDGSKQAHEITRPMKNGNSSYNEIVANLKAALKTIPSTETLSVIDPANVMFLSQSLDALLAIGVKNINFSLNYEADWEANDLSTLQKELQKVGERYMSLYRQGKEVAIDLIDSKIVTHLKDGYSCRDRCKFGHGQITVAPSGRLYPCERLVGEDSKSDVTIGHVDTGVDLEKVVTMADAKNKPDLDCENCALVNRCMYWCGCVNYATTGRVNETAGILCTLEQMLILEADNVGETLFGEKNPLFLQRFYLAV